MDGSAPLATSAAAAVTIALRVLRRWASRDPLTAATTLIIQLRTDYTTVQNKEERDGSNSRAACGARRRGRDHVVPAEPDDDQGRRRAHRQGVRAARVVGARGLVA